MVYAIRPARGIPSQGHPLSDLSIIRRIISISTNCAQALKYDHDQRDKGDSFARVFSMSLIVPPSKTFKICLAYWKKVWRRRNHMRTRHAFGVALGHTTTILYQLKQ